MDKRWESVSPHHGKGVCSYCLPFTTSLDLQSFSNFNVHLNELPGDLVKSYSDSACLGWRLRF